MNPDSLLDRYREERSQLLGAISEYLEKDPGVNAAWLFGSLGRGDEDALSDIDLWVIVDDEHIDNIITQPRWYASRIGTPILFLEAPQNAPDSGVYLMTCYDAKIAPHIVDWYWQPQSLANISGEVLLLFDRVGLIHNDQPPHFSGQPASKEIPERPIHLISFFWMMLMIAAKHAFRSPWGEEMGLLPLLVEPIDQAHHFLGQANPSTFIEIPSHKLPGEKIQLLYKLADRMSELMIALSERGEEVPTLIPPAAYRYLNLIESTISY